MPEDQMSTAKHGKGTQHGRTFDNEESGIFLVVSSYCAMKGKLQQSHCLTYSSLFTLHRHGLNTISDKLLVSCSKMPLSTKSKMPMRIGWRVNARSGDQASKSSFQPVHK
ncbi:hypothetical protein ACHAXM_000932 [Skeletonema potamos]